MGDDQLRPTLPSDTPEPVANVALACYDSEPENRPSFALIVHHLRQVGWLSLQAWMYLHGRQGLVRGDL